MLALAAAGATLWASLHVNLRWRLLLLTMSPSVISVALWWLLSPPSFRFAWGPIFTSAIIPLGWSWAMLAKKTDNRIWSRLASSAFAASVTVVVLFTIIVRTDWQAMTEEKSWQLGLSLPYVVTPIAQPELTEVSLASGLRVLQPRNGELCWSAFPLCTPQIADSVRLAGPTISDGFLP